MSKHDSKDTHLFSRDARRAPRYDRRRAILNAGYCCAALLLGPRPAAADPVKLKLSFYSSDRSLIYLATIKPFVDAISVKGAGLITIETFFSGSLSPAQAEQPALLRDGIADLASIVPSRNPELFPGTSVFELPGLFRSADEATEVFARLLAKGALTGFADLVIITPTVSGPESIHTRTPVASVADLKGLNIRVNNQNEADVLKELGAIPVLIPINETTSALTAGSIDGATLPPSMLFEFGVGRITPYHYMIRLGGIPAATVMSRKAFDRLSGAAQALVLENSGLTAGKQGVAMFDAADAAVLRELKADTRRQVVEPSAADLKIIEAAFAHVTSQWVASSDQHRKLLSIVSNELASMRKTN